MGDINMLSVKKVKLHGMTSSRWTTRDKITQYKGLINLYSRDRDIIEVDTSVLHRRQRRELKMLQKSVETDRHHLDNAIRGDRQQLRNSLAEHKDLQLAYENSPPKKAIESVHQINFTKRKEFDKLQFHMMLKSQELVDLKLKRALLEDRLKYASLGQLPVEKQAQITTGKVQDALLKKEGAISIRQIYLQIIAIMKRDALYFDAILATIRHDGVAQSHCMISGTQLGQLATEYLDDRRTEYNTLEEVVIKDMEARKEDLQRVRVKAEQAKTTLKSLIRRDSDINTCIIALSESHSIEDLKKDIHKLDDILSYLKNSVLVSNYEEIFPCLKEQARQKMKLEECSKKCEHSRDILLNKLNHAEVMENMLKNSMIETTSEYNARKMQLKNDINDRETRLKNNQELITYRNKLSASIRMCLRQLQQITRSITKTKKKARTGREMSESASESETIKPPVEDETNANAIIASLEWKLTQLSEVKRDQLDHLQEDEAYKTHEIMMNENSIVRSFEKEASEEPFLQGLYLEVSHVLTREDIKKQSVDIVKANSKNDDLIPMFVSSRPKRKF